MCLCFKSFLIKSKQSVCSLKSTVQLSTSLLQLLATVDTLQDKNGDRVKIKDKM